MTFLEKPFAFIIIIIVSKLLTDWKILPSDTKRALSRIIINITLPCAVLHAFENFHPQGAYYLLIVMGVLLNLAALLLAYIMTRKLPTMTRVVILLAASGLNIGNFSFPLIEAFFGTEAVAVSSFLDSGNALMSTCGNLIIVMGIFGLEQKGEKLTLKSTAMKFLKSATFDVYVVAIIVTGLGFQIPHIIMAVTAPAAASNAFLSMMLIGCAMRIEFNREFLGATAIVLFVKMFISAAVSLLLFNFMPIDRVLRCALVIAAFSPVSSAATILTEQAGADNSLTSYISSISIIIVLAVDMLLAAVWAV